MRRAIFLLVLCLLPSLASAQVQGDGLEGAFARVAGLWSRSDAPELARRIPPEGITIDVGDGPMGPLNARQATALLRRLFEQGETVGVQAGMLERVGGRPPRGFGAITWITRPEGTRVPLRQTVYFGLDWIDGSWRVSEIRLIP